MFKKSFKENLYDVIQESNPGLLPDEIDKEVSKAIYYEDFIIKAKHRCIRE